MVRVRRETGPGGCVLCRLPHPGRSARVAAVVVRGLVAAVMRVDGWELAPAIAMSPACSGMTSFPLAEAQSHTPGRMTEQLNSGPPLVALPPLHSARCPAAQELAAGPITTAIWPGPGALGCGRLVNDVEEHAVTGGGSRQVITPNAWRL